MNDKLDPRLTRKRPKKHNEPKQTPPKITIKEVNVSTKKYHKRQNDFMRHKINILIASLLMILGLAFLVIGNFDHVQGFFSHFVQDSVTGQAKNNTQKAKPNYNFKKVKPVDAQTLADAYKKRSNYKAIGQIAMPSLKINLNIYRGVGNVELNLGAGSMKPKQKMGQGNYCLAGHNMDDNRSYFSPLYSAVANHDKLVGRKVYLMNYYTVYYYKIDKAYFIASNRTDLLNDHKGKKQVSLFTCDFTGAGRLLVQGHYLHQQPLNLAPSSVRKAFQVK